MHICVFCSAQDVPEPYTVAASELGRRIAQGGHTLVWGGSDRGVMRTLADSAQEAGGKLVGISMEIVGGNARQNADEMVIEKDLATRKATMLKRSDAFVVMAGGIGTLDEATEMIALKRHRVHAKPIIFLDTAGFYEGTKKQFEIMEREGFFADGGKNVMEGFGNLAYFAATPEEAMRYIESYGQD